MDLDELRERAMEAADAADKVRDEHIEALQELQSLEIDVARARVLHYHSISEQIPEHQDLGEFDPRVYVARRKLKFKAAELATLDQRDIEATRAFSEALAVSHEKRLAREHDASEHWHRRFHTSLSIANGGAFLAIASHVFDKDASQAAIKASFWILVPFATGLLVGGSIPLVLAREVDASNRNRAHEQMAAKHRHAENLAMAAALLFTIGLGFALAAVWHLGHPQPALKPAQPVQTKPVSLSPVPPNSPATVSRPPPPPVGIPAPPQKLDRKRTDAPRVEGHTDGRG